jgi:hypothetical protein
MLSDLFAAREVKGIVGRGRMGKNKSEAQGMKHGDWLPKVALS